MHDLHTIYVLLLDEGVDCWRRVQATPAGPGLYRIVSKNAHPEDEHWQFQTGQLVRCETRDLVERSTPEPRLVAIEAVQE